MSATSEATVIHDVRANPPATLRRRTSRSIGSTASLLAAAALVALLGACKSSPHAEGRGASSKPSRSGKTGDDAARSAAQAAAPVSASEARLVRLDALVRDWDAAQGAGQDEVAKGLAGRIAGEVDADPGYFASASRGEQGLREQNLAVEALAFSRNRGATALLVDRLRDLDGSVVGNALIGLKIRADADTPLEPIIRLLRAQFPEARRYAPLALANVVRAREDAHRPVEANLSDAAMSALVGLVQDNDPYARLHAAKAMGALRRTDATDFLVLLLKDDRATIRIAAAAALERIGDPRSFPSVVALLDRVPDDQKAYVREILVSYAERIQRRPMSPAETKALDVSARAWDRWFAAREEVKAPPPGASDR